MSRKKSTNGKASRKLKSYEITQQALERIDHWGQYILLAGMMLACITVIAVTDSFLGPFRINGLDAGGLSLDIFSLGKWTMLLITAIFLSGILGYKIMAHRYIIITSPANLPLAILAILVALSCLASDYPAVALMGVPDIHFGALPLLAILLVSFITLNIQTGTARLRNLTIALSMITVANIVISGGYALGVEWQQVPIIGSLIVPSNLPAEAVVTGNLESTFNNPNYPSGLFGSLAVFFLALAATFNRRPEIGIYIGLSVVSLAIAALTLSTSGFATLTLMMPVLIIVLILNRRERAFRLTIVTATLVLALAIGWYASAYNPRIYSATIGWVEKLSEAFFEESIAPKADSKESKTPRTASTDKFTIEMPTEPGWDSSRIFLARETWKLVKERPLLGYGMDTMVYYFNYNSRETIKVLGLNQILTKPHNMYLQLAVGAGIPALLAFLALVGIYVFLTTKSIIVGFWESGEISPLQTALLLFVTAFLIQGLVNDLTIGTAMCFFVMLGLGYRLLYEDEHSGHLKSIS